MSTSSADLTRLFADWEGGDQEALARLIPIVYDELHHLASRFMRRETPGHTLQTSALVNEAYLRLVDQKHAHFENRAHFLAIAARLMRRILVEHARERHRAKRGGERAHSRPHCFFQRSHSSLVANRKQGVNPEGLDQGRIGRLPPALCHGAGDASGALRR